jgi:hypothetical protein
MPVSGEVNKQTSKQTNTKTKKKPNNQTNKQTNNQPTKKSMKNLPPPNHVNVCEILQEIIVMS